MNKGRYTCESGEKKRKRERGDNGKRGANEKKG